MVRGTSNKSEMKNCDLTHLITIHWLKVGWWWSLDRLGLRYWLEKLLPTCWLVQAVVWVSGLSVLACKILRQAESRGCIWDRDWHEMGQQLAGGSHSSLQLGSSS